MGQKLDRFQTVAFAELQAHPEMITDMLARHDSVPILLERQGDTVRVAAAPTYSKETDRILEEAVAEYAVLKSRGYSREDGFADLEAVQRELAKRAGES